MLFSPQLLLIPAGGNRWGGRAASRLAFRRLRHKMLPGIETRMPTRARSFLRELFSPGRQTEREAVPSLFLFWWRRANLRALPSLRYVGNYLLVPRIRVVTIRRPSVREVSVDGFGGSRARHGVDPAKRSAGFLRSPWGA